MVHGVKNAAPALVSVPEKQLLSSECAASLKHLIAWRVPQQVLNSAVAKGSHPHKRATDKVKERKNAAR